MGMLFEYYMYFASGFAENRKWLAACGLLAAGAPLSQSQEEDFKNANAESFVGWILFHVTSIGSNGRRQMFYITFMAQYFGLSREGIDILSKYGYGVTLDMYDSIRRHLSEQSEVVTR